MNVLLLTLIAFADDIRATKHNLSASALNTVSAASVDEVCVFCHTPHGAYQTKPLWNRDLSYQAAALYQLYGSTTLDAVVARPNGASKLCLSCHDGVLAIGAVMSLDATRPANIAMKNGVTTMPFGRTLLGLDLRNDHPISLVPNTVLDPEISLPPGGDPVQLREGATPGVKDTVQCTSCHDPHVTDAMFLRKSNDRAAVCTTCHTKTGWVGSMHEASFAPYPATGTVTVGDRGCLSCHDPHNASSPTRLLNTRNRSGGLVLPWNEENVCFQCHSPGGTGVDASRGRAAPDVRTVIQRPFHHPVELTQDVHQPVFTAKSPPPEEVVNTLTKHVECVDCHNPHQVIALSAPSPNKHDVHAGMKGVAKDGSIITDSAARPVEQHEICFRCHGDSFALTKPPAPTRPPSGSNKRLEFQPTNASFHPVGDVGHNQSPYLNNVAQAPAGQLRGNAWDGTLLSRQSTVLCSDCHNSDSTNDVPGSARGSSATPKGPHGSNQTRILRASYSTAVGTNNNPPFGGFNANNFALCFICHDQTALTSNGGSRTNFYQPGGVGAGRGNLHNLHLIDKTNASCHECHNNVHSNVDAANTEYPGFAPGESTHLINFAPNVNAHSGTNPQTGTSHVRPVYGRTTGGDPYCFLSCHGSDKMDGSDSVYRPPSP